MVYADLIRAVVQLHFNAGASDQSDLILESSRLSMIKAESAPLQTELLLSTESSRTSTN